MRRFRWAGLCFVGLMGCQTQIQHGLDERQANELERVLSERGFVARKVAESGKKPTYAIEVDDERAVDAVRVLSELGLPHTRAPNTLEVLGGGTLVPSATEERSRQLAGLSGDLAQTLESFEGVTAARVHLVIPAPPRPGQPAGAAKAAAFLKVLPGASEQLDLHRAELRALVAGSVEGLDPEQVTLVINEVASRVMLSPQKPAPNSLLRLLVAVFGLGVAGLAVTVILMVLQGRTMRGTGAKALRGQRASPRAVPTPVMTRRAAS